MNDAAEPGEAGADDAKPPEAQGDRKTPKASEIHAIVREEGEAEIARGNGALAWSGLAAGLSMGFSFLVMSLLHARLPDTPWRPLVASFGYATGFLIVVLGRQQLFTESTLTAILPVLTSRRVAVFWQAMRLWIVVLAANLVGTVAFAALVALPHVLPPPVRAAMDEVAAGAFGGDFLPVMVRAVLAGWLIALMVWLLPGAGPARPLIIIIFTYVVSLGGFSHTVAGSVEAAYAVIVGRAGIGDYFGTFLAPTLLGNTIGGVSLVAILNHAPLASENDV